MTRFRRRLIRWKRALIRRIVENPVNTTRLVRPIVILLAGLLSTSSWSAELPFRQFLPDYDSHVLSSASAQKLLQDDSGYIWIGFYSSGLSRYNGHSTVDYGLSDGIADLTVREVLQDKRGHLWVGSDTGIVVSDKPLDRSGRGERVRFVNSFGPTDIVQTRVRRNTIHIASDGTIWVATPGAGLIAYEWSGDALEETRFSIDLDRDGAEDPVHSVHSLDDGRLIMTSIGERGTVLSIDLTSGKNERSTSTMSPQEGAPPVPLSAWHADPSGEIWAGGIDGSLWLAPSPDGPFESIPSPLTGARIMDFVETPSGNIWTSSVGTGLARISKHDPANVQHYTRRDGLISETIWSILLDHEGNLWFAQNGGISRLMSDFEAFENYSQLLPDPSNFISLPPSPTEDGDPYLWVGTGSGLASIDPDDSVDVVTIDDGLPHNSVYALLRDDRSRLWIGTVDGFSILEPGEAEAPDGPVTDRIVTVHGESMRLRSYPGGLLHQESRPSSFRPDRGDGSSGLDCRAIGNSSFRRRSFALAASAGRSSRHRGSRRHARLRRSSVGGDERSGRVQKSDADHARLSEIAADGDYGRGRARAHRPDTPTILEHLERCADERDAESPPAESADLGRHQRRAGRFRRRFSAAEGDSRRKEWSRRTHDRRNRARSGHAIGLGQPERRSHASSRQGTGSSTMKRGLITPSSWDPIARSTFRRRVDCRSINPGATRRPFRSRFFESAVLT